MVAMSLSNERDLPSESESRSVRALKTYKPECTRRARSGCASRTRRAGRCARESVTKHIDGKS
eukprot:1030747-Pleurochrysis_carterae.AAC.1